MWRNAAGDRVDIPEPPPEFYRHIGDWQAADYDRNAFTRGTEAEVGVLLARLDPAPNAHILDIGCGTGRHLRALHERGFSRLTGIDISARLLSAKAAPAGVRLVQADARRLPLRDASCDVVLSLCQGGFGLSPAADAQVVAEVSRVLRTGGSAALTAFSLDFALRWMADGDAVDAERGLHHHRTEVRGPDGARRSFDLWTRCYTPTSVQRLLEAAGLEVTRISSVEPGTFDGGDDWENIPELLVIASKP